MISNEQAREYLDKQKKLTLKKSDFLGLTKAYRKLGLMISGLNRKHDDHFYYQSQKHNAKNFIRLFGDDFVFNPWVKPQGQKLAVLLFGKQAAPYVTRIWEHVNELPYQTGYDRRSFRSASSQKHLENKLEILENIYSSGSANGFVYLPLREQIQYSSYAHIETHAYLFAAVLDDKQANQSESLDELVFDIIQGEDEIGGVSRVLIKSMLLSAQEKNWKLVGDLLLAAQRQEGLRQTILECLDETHLGAMKYIMELIVEHDLMRFSSVVRSVDTWFGFGWDSPKKSVIKRVLEHALLLLDATNNRTELIQSSLDGMDFLETYVALWVLALKDTDHANAKAIDIITGDEAKERKLLALFFINETRRTNSRLIPYLKETMGEDIELAYWLLKVSPDFEVDNAIFEAIKKTAESLPAKGKKFSERVFSWVSYTIKPQDFYNQLVSQAEEVHLESLAGKISLIPSESRESYIRKVFPDYYNYGYYFNQDEKEPPRLVSSKMGWKRQVIHQAITDRNESVMRCGLTVLSFMDIEALELELMESTLSRKTKYLRQEIISLILSQPETQLKTSAQNLMAAKQIDQRLAGLELMTVIDKRGIDTVFVKSQTKKYLERSKFNKNEKIFLDKLNHENTTADDFNVSNGFGAIDYENLSPLIKPQVKFPKKDGIIKSLVGKKERVITRFVDENKTTEAINQLINLLKKHKNHEYQYPDYYGEMQYRLLSEHIWHTKDTKGFSAKEKLEALPLSKVWITWFEQSGLNDMEMCSAKHAALNATNEMVIKTVKSFFDIYTADLSKVNFKKEYYDVLNSNVSMILESLIDVHADKNTLSEIKLDMLEDSIAQFPEEEKKQTYDSSDWNTVQVKWMDILMVDSFLTRDIDQSSKRLWDINRFLMAQRIAYPNEASDLKTVLEKAVNFNDVEGTSDEVSIPLYHKGMATKDDLLLEALMSSNKFNLDADCASKSVKAKIVEKLNPPFKIFKTLKKNMISVELMRGDVETPVSKYMHCFYAFEGMEYLFEVLERMGDAVFSSGYYYNSTDKSSVFSRIIQKSQPNATDTYEAFAERIKSSKVTTKRLFEVACYATQWAHWIGRYLKVEQLHSAVWWFHAHCSDYMNAEKETQVSCYSNIPLREFERGSLDIEWFESVYQSLGKAKWKMLHDATKYISDGHARRQVKLYSNVLLGEVKITETLKKIKEKRDKIYVCALGLIPLSKVNPDADLLKRYHILQTFLKESKQFGSQRQESEKKAVEVGLENLSRNAGFSDSTRFSWAMESKAAQKIMTESKVLIDEVMVQLEVDDWGKAFISVDKNGKKQKSIPAKLKNHKEIKRLKADKSYLAKQYSRTRASLESAMVKNDRFSIAEIVNIIMHPVVRPMLEKLVLFNPKTGVSGYWKRGVLVDYQDVTHELTTDSELVIAHPSHLYEAGIWSSYQRQLFTQQIKQPFKQVFRELYLITADEQESHNRSQRYQGHQIQPKKTAALLRGRGWTLNYEDGLRKVFHKQGFTASLYAMADWYSPADTESPTLEYVAFTSLSDYKEIPLKDICPLTFSEIMRDVDLVVSVAHAGGVDPEASHSTMEMRADLARESARLFKFKNITVKRRHVLIKGHLAEYSIHLGSGNVSKDGLALSIIPVHSQHRGRVFLPFVDDDPKSAEIIAKMKLLAEDNKIKDPTVLAQINR